MHLNPVTVLFGVGAVAFIGYVLWLVYAVMTSPIPLPYNFKSVLIRWRSTAATILGVALVVMVFILLHAMAAGLEKSSANTGDPRNIMIVRKGSTAESSSIVMRDQFKLVEYLPQIARDAQNQPLISADLVVI